MYKRINELGLKVVEALAYQTSITAETGQGTGVCNFRPHTDHYVSAADLEALLEKAVEVAGVCQTGVDEPQLITFSNHRSSATHTALLINIKPIEKPKVPVSKSELINTLSYCAQTLEMRNLISRIEQSGVSDE